MQPRYIPIIKFLSQLPVGKEYTYQAIRHRNRYSEKEPVRRKVLKQHSVLLLSEQLNGKKEGCQFYLNLDQTMFRLKRSKIVLSDMDGDFAVITL